MGSITDNGEMVPGGMVLYAHRTVEDVLMWVAEIGALAYTLDATDASIEIIKNTKKIIEALRIDLE